MPYYYKCRTCGKDNVSNRPHARYCPKKLGENKSRCYAIANSERAKQFRSIYRYRRIKDTSELCEMDNNQEYRKLREETQAARIQREMQILISHGLKVECEYEQAEEILGVHG